MKNLEVKMFSATAEAFAEGTRTAIPLDEALELIETQIRFNPDEPLGTLVLPADVSKDDALAILDEIKTAIEANL